MSESNDEKELDKINKQIKDLGENLNRKEDDLKNLLSEKSEEIANLEKKYKELCDYKDKMSYLLKNYIINMDSLIINNNNYNSSLKHWISPKSNICANLLYRLTRDGPEILTFHNLCDEKGPTLILFHIKEGDKVGFFVNGAFDCSSSWKNDNDAFIFNLDQNKKYKRFDSLNPETFYCNRFCGPSVNGFGCNPDKNLDLIYHSANVIDNFFYDGSKLLPSYDIEKEYQVSECEVFQIIIS